MNDSPPALSPGQIFVRFLHFGLLAWGGSVAQIAMIRRELVDEERWLSSGRFNRLLAIYQVLPGPEAHELCVHIGMLAGRRLGGFLAGLGFMLPGFVLMFALSWLYFTIDITQSALGPVWRRTARSAHSHWLPAFRSMLSATTPSFRNRASASITTPPTTSWTTPATMMCSATKTGTCSSPRGLGSAWKWTRIMCGNERMKDTTGTRQYGGTKMDHLPSGSIAH